ncbi:hypothetical protein V6U77_08190 [Micromonospora sp. CPCC 205546]|uniref:hypothetical protein n=1 Tax=Micromonospora sp. CPCC 205546 TaxID=3122397 RepID=UPI002FF3D9FA
MSVISLVLGLAVLTGCALNKGTALAADFANDWAGTPDVVDIRTNAENTLPFLGQATGVLVLADGTPADRVTGLAGELREYVVRHDEITGRIAADGVTFTVVGNESRTGEALGLWRSLAADERVADGDIRAAVRKETDRWWVGITAVDAAGALALFRDMVADGGRHRPPAGGTSLQVNTERGARTGLMVGTGSDGGAPTGAIAAYEAVAARYQVVHASLKPDRASIVVAQSADRDHAEELARRAAPTLGAVEVTRRVR